MSGMSQKSAHSKKRNEYSAMPSGKDSRHSSHAPHNESQSSQGIRSSKDAQRRNSRLSGIEERKNRIGSSGASSNTDDNSYWKIVMNPAAPNASQQSENPRPSARQPTSKTPSVTSRRKDPPDPAPSARPPRVPPPKPFACTQCERRFERIGHLKSHVDAVHNLRQPYVCTYGNCGKTFSHRSSLYRHVKGVHEKNRHLDKSDRRHYKQGPQGSGSSYDMSS